MKQLRVGIIGQGRSGHDIHARTIVHHVADRFRVVAVADPRPGQLESELLPAEGPGLYDEMAAAFYGNLYEALVHGAPLEVKLEEVRRQIEIIEECHRQNPLPPLGKQRGPQRRSSVAKGTSSQLSMYQRSRRSLSRASTAA